LKKVLTMQISADGWETIAEKWNGIRLLVDMQLEKYVRKLSNDCPNQLRDAIGYSLLSSGKRLRPLLALLAAESIVGDYRVALPAACAVEMIHCYSLIHDDLPAMDDDDLRRGLPTCHKKFDEATAILAGDALQAMAFEILCQEVRPADRAVMACGLLAKAAGPEALVGGQMDDLLAEKSGGDHMLLQAIHRRKTGSMISVSVQLGGVMAGANTQQLQSLQQYGDNIGLAFQIVDDLLDVEGSAAAVGKRTGKDQSRGKLTYPGIYGLEASRTRASELIDSAIRQVDSNDLHPEGLVNLARYVLNRSH
jgi:geranylgeranyl diphosphate synthase, type II